MPDLDILWFYLIDDRQTLHHKYWIHKPIYWLGFLLIITIFLYFYRKKNPIFISVVFFSNVFLHLILDTITGKIDWLYPFSNYSLALVEVPSRYNWWVWNFVFHWTFLLEIAIILWAIVIFVKNNQWLSKKLFKLFVVQQK